MRHKWGRGQGVEARVLSRPARFTQDLYDSYIQLHGLYDMTCAPLLSRDRTMSRMINFACARKEGPAENSVRQEMRCRTQEDNVHLRGPGTRHMIPVVTLQHPCSCLLSASESQRAFGFTSNAAIMREAA